MKRTLTAKLDGKFVIIANINNPVEQWGVYHHCKGSIGFDFDYIDAITGKQSWARYMADEYKLIKVIK
jgi:hypothetical protein